MTRRRKMLAASVLGAGLLIGGGAAVAVGLRGNHLQLHPRLRHIPHPWMHSEEPARKLASGLVASPIRPFFRHPKKWQTNIGGTATGNHPKSSGQTGEPANGSPVYASRPWVRHL